MRRSIAPADLAWKGLIPSAKLVDLYHEHERLGCGVFHHHTLRDIDDPVYWWRSRANRIERPNVMMRDWLSARRTQRRARLQVPFVGDGKSLWGFEHRQIVSCAPFCES